MLNFCDFIQVYVFSTNHHLKRNLESVWNYYSHIHLTEGISMLLFLVNKIALSQ